MKRCSFCEWIPILPWPVWPLAWQCVLGQNTVVGSMMILLAMRGNIATRSMSGPPFALQLHRTTVWCGATQDIRDNNILTDLPKNPGGEDKPPEEKPPDPHQWIANRLNVEQRIEAAKARTVETEIGNNQAHNR